MIYEEFLQELHERLKGLLLDVTFDGTTFTQVTSRRIPGRHMIINGQRMDEPDRAIEVIITIEVCEAADVTDGENPIPMAQLLYKMTQGGEVVQETNLGAYLEDMDWLLQPLTRQG